MDIDWAALIRVAGVSLGFGVGIVTVFSVGLLGATQLAASRATGPTAGSSPAGPAGARVPGALLAGVCFVACAAAVLFGLYLLIPQFHN